MNFRLAEAQLAHLRTVGVAIDGHQQPTVFDGGLVGFSDATESEVMKDVAQGQAHRSPAGSRQGRRARPRRAPAPDYAFRSDALELAHGANFRRLATHYEASAFEDRNGVWVAVSGKPLGHRGPAIHFLIAVPVDERLSPRAWAFEKLGPRARLMSLKHTNFPDASVCAFPHGHWPWPNPAGLLGLVDIYVLWAVRKLHRDHFGWWPGPQVGPCAHYRLREFDRREQCGCGSNKRYGECHLAPDLLEDPKAAAAEFRRQFECDYDDRRPPETVMAAARARWGQPPSMATAFAHRPDPSRVHMI
jgi:hypothetical protein